jgi:ribose transport system substrate-binding protein
MNGSPVGGRIMKKIASCFIIVLLIAALTSCGQKSEQAGYVENGEKAGDNAPVARDGSRRIALVMKTLTNPFFVEMEKGARRAEKEFAIELIVKSGAKETSIEQQISIVEELIRDKVDAIVIAPGSSVELIPVLKKAQDAGIPIVNIDNRLDPELSKKAGLVDVPFISVDNVKGAYLSAKFACDRLSKPTKAAILEGIRVAKNAQDRKQGALNAFKESKNVELVASETANWKIDEAAEVTKKIFAKNPDIGLLFCANDMMAIGAMHYLEDSGKKQVLVAAYDALEEAKTAIKNGKLVVTIDQQADVQGYEGVKAALAMIHGKKPPVEKLVDVKIVSKETL